MSRPYPNLGLTGDYDLGVDDWGDEMNANLLKLSALVQGGILGRVEAVPVDPEEGDVYVLTEAPNAQKVAVYDEAAWTYYTPAEGWLLYDRDAEEYITFDGAAWTPLQTGFEDAPSDGNTYGRKDGAWAEIEGGGGGGGGLLYRFGSFFTSAPAANEILMAHPVTDGFTLPANFEDSQFKSFAGSTNPSGDTIFTLKREGADIGTVTVSAAGAVTFDSDEAEIEAGDVLTLHAPAASNGMTNWSWTFRSLYVAPPTTGEPVNPVVVMRSFQRTPGGELDVPWVPTAGNILIAMIYGRSGFGAAAGWTDLGGSGNGNVSAYHVFAKVATGAETGIMNPSDSNGFVGSGVLFEIDAAYMPAGGVSGFIAGFSNLSQAGPAIDLPDDSFVLVGIGNQDPPAPFDLTFDPAPNSIVQAASVDRNSSYLFASAFVVDADAGNYATDFTASGNAQGFSYIILKKVSA